MHFYKCLNCGDIAMKLGKGEALLQCCDERMKKLVPGEVEGSFEKHIPIVTKEDHLLKVSVGEVEHPMSEEHSIEWIAVECKDGFSIKYLNKDQKPEAFFYLNEEPISVYAYCNLHGLWKSKGN